MEERGGGWNIVSSFADVNHCASLLSGDDKWRYTINAINKKLKNCSYSWKSRVMAPKKKGKKAGGGAGSGEGSEAAGATDVTPPLVIPQDIPHYVTLEMRLLNWSYLNFKLRVKTTTRLFALKQQIQKRHGPIADLKICKGNFAEANEMTEDMDTLADYGIEGAPEDELPETICIIHYDFKPQQHDNPLLLATEDK